ncbi:MAG: hypothetical protein IJN72_07150 [Firmicutes bacterium]|nr:hypothetical protein [Bacillota bacterium]
MDKEKYIKTVLKEVKFHYDHQEIEKELETHIYERSQYLQAKGMAAESAETEAVQRMGDPQEMGRELNKAHNPLVGYVWFASCIFAFCLAAAAAWFGIPQVYKEVKDLITEPTPIEHFAMRDKNDTLCRTEIDESLFLDSYSIWFKEVALLQNSSDRGGYYIGLFYEHEGESGKDIYATLSDHGYDDIMFLNKNGQHFSYRDNGYKSEPFVLSKYTRNYYLIWIPDLSETRLYVNYNAFGQQDKCEIDLSSLFEEIKTKEAQL